MKWARIWSLFRWVLRYEQFRNRVTRGILMIISGALLVVYFTAEYAAVLKIHVSAFNPEHVMLLTLILLQLPLLNRSIAWFTAALYEGRNIEHLLSYPLAKREIVLSYSMVFLLRLYLYELVVLYPIIYLGWANAWFTFKDVLLGGLYFILLPVLTLSLSVAASIIGMKFAPGGRRYRLLSLLLAMIIFVAVIWVFTSSESMRSLLNQGLNHSGIGIVVLLGLSILLSLFNDTLLHRYWLEGREKGSSGHQHLLKLGGKWGLLEREVLNYIRVPSFILNYCVIVIIGVFLSVLFSSQLKTILSGSYDPQLTEQLAFFITIQFISVMMPVSGNAFSREGKEWESLKALPLSLKHIFKVKLLFSLMWDVAGLIPALAYLLLYSGTSNGESKLWLLQFMLAGTVLHTGVRVVIDLIHPDFAWSNPAQTRSAGKRYLSYGVNLTITFLLAYGWVQLASDVLFRMIYSLLIWCLGILLYLWILYELGKADVYRSKMIKL